MRKTEPVWRGTVMDTSMTPPELLPAEEWTLFDFNSVFAAFRDDEVFGSEQYNNTIGLVFGPTILGMHGKQHHDHRSLISKAFRQSALERWEPAVIDPICDQLVDDIKNDGAAPTSSPPSHSNSPPASPPHCWDLPEEDLDLFRRLSFDLISIYIDIEAGLTASVELRTYFQQQVDQRRSKMTNDIIGDLVGAEIDGEKLTDEAIISFLRLLLPAGLETTYPLVEQPALSVAHAPGPVRGAAADRELIPAAIEEGIRYETPLVSVPRTTRDVEVNGVPIGKGAQVNLCMGSANRDETRWTDAETFDIHRPRRAHVSFAGGIHSCLGMHLARVETRAMLNSLFDRVTDLRAGARRGRQDRRHAVPLPEDSARDVPPTRPSRQMRSRAAILHDVGGPWSVEDFELDPPTHRRGSRRDGRRGPVPLGRPHPQGRHGGFQRGRSRVRSDPDVSHDRRSRRRGNGR